MGWRVFQAFIVFAVVASNIHWQWTPNGYAAAVTGIAAAWLLSALLLCVIEGRRFGWRTLMAALYSHRTNEMHTPKWPLARAIEERRKRKVITDH